MPDELKFESMSHVCPNCHRAFETELQLELHRDTCGADDLVCGACGEQFSESVATRDGWHYACPNDGCDAAGIGEELYEVDAARAR